MAGTQKAAPAWSVRQASAADLPGMARSLARAFYDDPIWVWFIPDDATRSRRLERVIGSFARHVYLRHGSDCYTTDAYDGASLWAPPGHERLSPLDVLRTLPGWIEGIGWRDLRRAKRGLDSLEEVHPREPHYFLPFLGVVPEAQGRGLGTALMRPVLEKCDRGRVPAYLEATTARSRNCYERLGFEIRSEERLAGDGPPFFPMWRPAGTNAGPPAG
jgi:GNAT superfamily N-acetyltransferase